MRMIDRNRKIAMNDIKVRPRAIMKMMSVKQYEKTLDEQFEIAGILVAIAHFPTGWFAYDVGTDYEICISQPDKKTAIQKVEEYAGAKYNPKTTKFL